MPSDLESAGFSGYQSVFVGLRGSQGCGRIQLDQIIIFEHIFNIKRRPDTLPAIQRVASNGQHFTGPDNIGGGSRLPTK
jgi:hypothetical protein